ncbi:MAG: hypothetical protein V1660_01395 [archaeon]
MANTNYELLRQTFNEILEIERTMEYSYSQIISQIDNKEINSILSKIMEDEKKHQRNVQKILDILS